MTELEKRPSTEELQQQIDAQPTTEQIVSAVIQVLQQTTLFEWRTSEANPYSQVKLGGQMTLPPQQMEIYDGPFHETKSAPLGESIKLDVLELLNSQGQPQ